MFIDFTCFFRSILKNNCRRMIENKVALIKFIFKKYFKT